MIGHPERSEGSSEQGSFPADSAGQDDMELYKLYSITACSLWLSALLSELCVLFVFEEGFESGHTGAELSIITCEAIDLSLESCNTDICFRIQVLD